MLCLESRVRLINSECNQTVSNLKCQMGKDKPSELNKYKYCISFPFLFATFIRHLHLLFYTYNHIISESNTCRVDGLYTVAEREPSSFMLWQYACMYTSIYVFLLKRCRFLTVNQIYL